MYWYFGILVESSRVLCQGKRRCSERERDCGKMDTGRGVERMVMLMFVICLVWLVGLV